MANVSGARAQTLILSWLLSRDDRSGTQSALRAALKAYLADGHTANLARKAIDSAVSDLQEAGFVVGRGRNSGRLELVEEGKKRALADLGVSSLPGSAKGARQKWAWIQHVALVRLALGADAGGGGKRELSSDAVKARILQQHFGLHPGAKLTLSEVVNMLCAVAMAKTRAAPRRLRQQVVARWLLEPSQEAGEKDAPGAAETPPQQPEKKDPEKKEPDDLATFAEKALAAAKRSPTGRRDGDKVFVSHVYRELVRGGDAAGLSLPDFKSRLVEAQKKGLLRFSRADLVEDMSPEDVRESEVERLSARFHLLRID